ncbi:hypothetical protein, partial [Lentzea atacamensis]|uniref:hypothetical protein n=1 Tax=Lentzea atacamensis TaxID=531938 RepID=UPI00147508BD
STGWSGSQIKVAISEDSSSPALGSLAEQGIHADGVDGERLIAEAGRNPLQIAAQVATVLKPGCVRVRSGVRIVVLLWHGRTLAMTNCSVPRWRICQLSQGERRSISLPRLVFILVTVIRGCRSPSVYLSPWSTSWWRRSQPGCAGGSGAL